MKIREDNITFESLMEDLARGKMSIKEYVTRSEHASLFTTTMSIMAIEEEEQNEFERQSSHCLR